jgi:hypothetical protein
MRIVTVEALRRRVALLGADDSGDAVDGDMAISSPIAARWIGVCQIATYAPRHGELAQTSAITAAATNTQPLAASTGTKRSIGRSRAPTILSTVAELGGPSERDQRSKDRPAPSRIPS